MNYKPIIIQGEPNSIFLEIYFKILKSENSKSPLILIASQKLLKLQMRKFKFRMNIRLLDADNLKNFKLDNKSLNLINVNYKTAKALRKFQQNQINIWRALF